jgi:hypothetical protein
MTRKCLECSKLCDEFPDRYCSDECRDGAQVREALRESAYVTGVDVGTYGSSTTSIVTYTYNSETKTMTVDGVVNVKPGDRFHLRKAW